VTETQFQIDVADMLRLGVRSEAQWTMFPGGGFQLPPRTGSLMKAMGLQAGWPDLQMIHEGAAFGLELKMPKGRLSPSQEERFPLLERAGMKIAVCRSIDEVLAALDLWRIPTRIHR